MIYFIKSYCNKYIKIGYTTDIQRRLKELQTASPKRLKVLGTLEGGTQLEAGLHELFKKHRVEGEWFRNSSKEMKSLQILLTGGCKDCPYELNSVRSIQKALIWLQITQKNNRNK